MKDGPQPVESAREVQSLFVAPAASEPCRNTARGTAAGAEVRARDLRDSFDGAVIERPDGAFDTRFTNRTSKPRVHIAGGFPARERLSVHFDLASEPKDVDAVVAFRTTTVDAAYLDRAGPRLRVVAMFGVGHDNIDLDAARERGVYVTNTPDITTKDVAQFTLGLILDAMRLITQGDRLVRLSHPAAFEPGRLLGRSLTGATVGIVGGHGRIGAEVSRLLSAFGANVRIAGRGGLDDLVGEVDVLTLHCSLNDSTRHLVDGSVLQRLGRGAFLINVARGAVVDESALVTALEHGAIAGAALDVFEYEPAVSDRLRGFTNVVLTPHLGAATLEARLAKATSVCERLEEVLLREERPANVVY